MNIYQNQYQPYQPYQMRQNGIIWVQGVEGAKAYQLAPNSNAMLLDSDTDGRFFIKVSDNVGMCTLRTFKYEEVIDTPKPTEPVYVSKEEFEQAIEQLKGEINEKLTISTIK